MKTFKQFIKEKTYNIGKDVDMIYNKYFKKRIDKITKGEYNFPRGEMTYGTFNSSELKTKDCQKAHEINPVDIYCGIFDIKR